MYRWPSRSTKQHLLIKIQRTKWRTYLVLRNQGHHGTFYLPLFRLVASTEPLIVNFIFDLLSHSDSSFNIGRQTWALGAITVRAVLTNAAHECTWAALHMQSRDLKQVHLRSHRVLPARSSLTCEALSACLQIHFCLPHLLIELRSATLTFYRKIVVKMP